MLNCLSSNSLFENDVFKMNQAPSSHASLFGQPPKFDYNGVGNFNQPTTTNGLPPNFHRFTPAAAAPHNANFYQQALAQYRTDPQFRNSAGTPVGFSDNEFPSLGLAANRGSAGFGVGSIGQFRTNVGFGRAGFANLLKQQVSAERIQPEFQIQNEDFPALPKAQNDTVSITGKRSDTPSSLGTLESLKNDRGSIMDVGKLPQQQLASNGGIQLQLDGSVSGIPPGMVNDQFGMVGLMAFIRVISTEPHVSSLALGQELTKLGVNLSAQEKNLYQTFAGPWADIPCRPQDIDCQVPLEYLTNASICETLAPIKLNRYGEDLLFYLFYNFAGELLQLAAAAELYNRDWRYHKEERVWITRAPGIELMEKTTTTARGVFYVFDPNLWRKVQKELHLDLSKLEERPALPPHSQQLQQPQLVHSLPNVGLAGAMHNS